MIYQFNMVVIKCDVQKKFNFKNKLKVENVVIGIKNKILKNNKFF